MTVEDECISGSAYPAFMGVGDSLGQTTLTNSSRRKSNGMGGHENATSHNATTTRSTKRANKTLRGEGETFKIGNDANRDEDNDTEDEEEEEEEEDEDIERLTEKHGGRGVQNACSIGNIARAIFRDIREKKKGLSEHGFGRFGVHLWRDEFGESAGRRLESRRGDEVYREKIETNGVRGEGDDDDDDDEWWWWWWYEWWWRDDERRLPRRRRRQQQQQQQQQQHLTYPDHFCACKGFTWDVVSRDEKLMCKHMLAAALAESVGGCDEVEMDDAVLANVLAREMLE